MNTENKDRLQKILASAGYGSRRACESIIEEGRVTVDGHIAQLGDKADPTTQRITLDGVPIRTPQGHTYIIVYKPRGFITTTDDPKGRRTVMDLIDLPQRLYPVGRLDADSEGLILLTDDGGLTERLTHPRYGHPRTYRVLVSGEPTDETLERWQRGITLDGKRTRFDQLKVEQRVRDQTWLLGTVHEGRKHLVRRLVAALGHPAQRLIRVAMGSLQLGDLAPRRWRYLRDNEVNALRKDVGLPLQARSQRLRPQKRHEPGGRSTSGGRGAPRPQRSSVGRGNTTKKKRKRR